MCIILHVEHCENVALLSDLSSRALVDVRCNYLPLCFPFYTRRQCTKINLLGIASIAASYLLARLASNEGEVIEPLHTKEPKLLDPTVR